jgi:uncharacterized protein YndB with AHSA1/START domain
MQGSVTVHVAAPPERVWALVSDVTNTGRFSPETFEAEWIDGATGPAVGARFRGHVRRTGWLGKLGITYWTKCTVTACEPGREFTFVVGSPERAVNTWSYRFAPAGDGTDVTESYQLADNTATRWYWKLAGARRGKVNEDGMRRTLEGVKAAAEAGSEGTATGS